MATKNPAADWLRARGLLSGRAGKSDLLRFCHHGQLLGGLSVSLKATPDEVVGPLTHLLGGAAKKLKVLDVRVREGEPMELQVEYALPEAHAERWAVEDVPGLLHNLNDLYAHQADVAAGVLLGEFDDMWQLWAVPKSLLPELIRQRWFFPPKDSLLERLARPGEESG